MESRFEIDEDWCYMALFRLHKRVTEEQVWEFCQRVFDLIQSGVGEEEARGQALEEMLS